MTRRPNTQIEISMFPFLSVLCAVVGILMLFMIAIISTRAIRAEDLLRGVVIEKERYAILDSQIRQLEDRLIRRRREHKNLQQLHAGLVDLITAKEDLAELALAPAGDRHEGTQLGAPEEILIVPDSRRKITKKPILVEVTGEAFVVHPEKKRYALRELDRENSPLRGFINSVDRAHDRQYLLLLLHPNGVTAYKKLRRYIKDSYPMQTTAGKYRIRTSRIDLGVEPFSRNWLLRAGKQDSAK